MAKWVQFYKIVQPKPAEATITDSQFLGDGTTYGAYSWYQRIIQGSANRISRYREYNLMNNDIDISRALDIIAEEMTGNVTKGKDPILIQVEGNNEDFDATLMETLNGALQRWVKVHKLGHKIFRIARGMVMYGDMFFIKRDAFSKWEYIPVENVIAAVVSENDFTDVVAWQIRRDIKSAEPHNGQTYFFRSTSEYAEHIPADKVIRFTLNDEMSDSAPFGESILKPVYKTFKQRELLEDAILIYRVQRAPERRVFYVDVGKMPPNRVKQYLENFKNEIKQKKVPSQGKGGTEMDSVYNPACLSLETRIPLLDGRTLTLSEIINEFDNGKENWVYSVDPVLGNVVPGIVSWAGITRKSTETIKLVLDNGEEVICTPDHKIPVQGKGFVEAKNITTEDSLFPFEENMSSSFAMKNHRIVSIEKYNNMDVGTLTIDGKEKYHNFHTFALSSGIFVKNSINEDFFIASRPDGRSSKVDVLPGGQSLGEISDLEHFLEKIWRGLRIPSSYMNGGADSAVFNDGKTGIAYIQELRFALFIERLQVSIEEVLDGEFKKFLKAFGIHIDESLYSLRLPEPSNFGRYREQEMDSVLMNSYSAIDNIPHFAKRFTLKKYLQLSKDQILENEKLKAQELGIEYDENNPEASWPQIYGVAAEGAAGMGGMPGAEGEMLAGGMPGEGGEEVGGEGAATATASQPPA